MKTELRFEPYEALLAGERGLVAGPERPCVAEAMSSDFISLPAWFPAEKAASVLRLKSKGFAFISGPGGQTSLVALEELDGAPVRKSVAWCVRPLGPTVAQDATLDDAVALMDRHAIDHVPVVMGRLLVGIVTRDAAIDRLLAATVPQPLRLAA